MSHLVEERGGKPSGSIPVCPVEKASISMNESRFVSVLFRDYWLYHSNRPHLHVTFFLEVPLEYTADSLEETAPGHANRF